MAKCKSCNRKGIFFKVDRDGLCYECAPVVHRAIDSCSRVIQDSMRLAHDGKTFKTRLSRCELVIERAKTLRDYERRGIPTISPSPSKLASEYRAYRSEIILEEAQRAADKSIQKADVAATPRTKQSALSSGLLKIQEIAEHLDDPSYAGALIANQQSLIHHATLNGFLEAARKAEFKGNRKKALDQYQEALYFVLNDAVPDEDQAEEIADLKAKIDELQQ